MAASKKPFQLTVDPNELSFPVPADKKNVEPGRITIQNPTSTPFGFKIKTTAPQQFCVKPCLGRIDPGQIIHVEVRLSTFEPKKVKFLVQAVECQPDEDSNVFAQKFAGADVSEHLIRGIVVPVEGGAAVPDRSGDLMQTVQAPAATSTPQQSGASLSEPADSAPVAPAPVASTSAAVSAPTTSALQHPVSQSHSHSQPPAAVSAATSAPAPSGDGSVSVASESAEKKKEKEDVLKSLGCEVSTEEKNKVVIVVSNIVRSPVAYKIKTTAPKDFLVKPSCGLLQPGEQASISVSPMDPANISLKAKFLVSAVVLNHGEQIDLAAVTDFFKAVDAARLEEKKLRLPFGDSTLPLPAPSTAAAPQALAAVQAATMITTANPTLPLPPVPVTKLPSPPPAASASEVSSAAAQRNVIAPTPVPAAAGAGSRADDPLALRSMAGARQEESSLRRRKAEEASAAPAGAAPASGSGDHVQQLQQFLANTNNTHALAIVLFAFFLGILFGYFVLA